MPNAGRKQTFHSLRKWMNVRALLYGKNNIGNIITSRKCIIPFWYQRRRGKANPNFSFDQLIQLPLLFYSKICIVVVSNSNNKNMRVWVYPLLSLAVASTAHGRGDFSCACSPCACRGSEVPGHAGWRGSPVFAAAAAVVELWWPSWMKPALAAQNCEVFIHSVI